MMEAEISIVRHLLELSCRTACQLLLWFDGAGKVTFPNQRFGVHLCGPFRGLAEPVSHLQDALL